MSRTLYDCPLISRRITITLFATQSLARAAFIACGTVSAIVGMQLSGSEAMAGVPAAVLALAGALAAVAVATTTERIGRRKGLALGLGVGVLGMGVAAGAIVAGSFQLFLGGLALMGVASAAMLLERFAVAEVHPPERRGRAISLVVIGGATGSVAGPLIVGPAGKWAQVAGMPELAGPYLAAMVVLAVAAVATFVWLRPDPRDVGRKMAERHPESSARVGATRSTSQILRTPAIFIAILTMALSQMVMIMVMVVTSPYMIRNQHDLTDISIVIAAHTFGMFALSFVAGRLADRWGRGWVMLTGAGLLILACALAPLSSDVLPLAAALFLLGLGWNFCFVGGSTLLSDHLSAAERAKIQGTNDLLIGSTTAAASLGSGLIFALTSYAVMDMVGIAISLVPLGLAGWWVISRRELGKSSLPRRRDVEAVLHPEGGQPE